MSGPIEDPFECGCEGVKQGLVTCLTWIGRVEEGLIIVAVVTWLHMAILLGLAFVYGCCEGSKKLSKKYKKSEESKKQRKKDQWEEDVTNMEVCLKANKRARKEVRGQAQRRERNRKFEAEMERGARVALKDQEFLKASPKYKALAESQL